MQIVRIWKRNRKIHLGIRLFAFRRAVFSEHDAFFVKCFRHTSLFLEFFYFFGSNWIWTKYGKIFILVIKNREKSQISIRFAAVYGRRRQPVAMLSCKLCVKCLWLKHVFRNTSKVSITVLPIKCSNKLRRTFLFPLSVQFPKAHYYSKLTNMESIFYSINGMFSRENSMPKKLTQCYSARSVEKNACD